MVKPNFIKILFDRLVNVEFGWFMSSAAFTIFIAYSRNAFLSVDTFVISALLSILLLNSAYQSWVSKYGN